MYFSIFVFFYLRSYFFITYDVYIYIIYIIYYILYIYQYQSSVAVIFKCSKRIIPTNIHCQYFFVSCLREESSHGARMFFTPVCCFTYLYILSLLLLFCGCCVVVLLCCCVVVLLLLFLLMLLVICTF